MPMFKQFVPMKRTNQSPFVFGRSFQRQRTQQSATIPEGTASGSQSAIVYQRPKRKVIRTSFKSKVVSAKPAKHYAYTADQTMTQDVIYTTCPTAGVVQGTTNATRDGDAIYLAALKGRYTYAAPVNAPGVYTGRLIIGWSGEEYPTLGSDFGTGLTTTELFLPNTSTVPINGLINPKAFTVIYDETVDADYFNTGAIVGNTATGTFNIPLDVNFVYQASASTMGKTKNLYVVFISEQFGSAALTPTGSVAIAFDLIFK